MKEAAAMRAVTAMVLTSAIMISGPISAQKSEPLRVDHYVYRTTELEPIQGHLVNLYVRERVMAEMLARTEDFSAQVVLFVHGAGTPAEVAFDVPYETYSWMAHLARAGFDVFSMDVTGYGRSSRPFVMNDVCNLASGQQEDLLGRDCESSYDYELGNIESDWNDIDAVIDYISELRDVERVSLVGWSLGGPRAGGYAARNPSRVGRLVLLAPAYARDSASDRPSEFPRPGASFTKQSAADFAGNWDRQAGCERQYDPDAAATIWAQMLASDPVGATWGTGVRRAPRTTVWGWNQAAVANMRTPMLIVQGIHDAQVLPERAEALYEDLGSTNKVYIDLGCASHNAMWERVHLEMFDASVEWLTQGTVNGQAQAILRMGY